MKVKYLVVDDEPLARKLILSHASKVESLDLVGECGHAMDAAHVLRTKKVDLMFLDIQMPEVSGIQFASALKNPPSVILTTAFRNFAPEAFDLEVVDYLLKPISFERFLRAVNKVLDRPGSMIASTQQALAVDAFIYVRADRKMHKVFLSEIVLIESLDDYVKVYLESKVLVTRESITHLEEKLPDTNFVRTHRSFIINTRWVKTITNESITVNGRELPFGRAFKKSALQVLLPPNEKR